MSTKYTLLIPGMIVLSLAFMSQVMPERTLRGQWQMLRDEEKQDSLFREQLIGIDTLTAFPKEIIILREQFQKLSKKERAAVPAENIEMLNEKDLEQYKQKARAMIIKQKKEEDELAQVRPVIYEFQANGIIKMYAIDAPQFADTSIGWIENFSQKKILLFLNPALQGASELKDTMAFDVLYLSADSLSINPGERHNSGREGRPVNFKRYTTAECGIE